MKLGIGGLKWRPADFWASTLTEFFAAIKGYNEAQGVETEAAAPSANEIADLVEKYG